MEQESPAPQSAAGRMSSIPAETSYDKLSCSPEIVEGDGFDKGVFLATEEELEWGQPLPICGYVRVTAEIAKPNPGSSFGIYLRSHQSEDFVFGSENLVLGRPPIQDDAKAFEILGSKGELYFNTHAYNEYTVLAPGDYDVSLRYFNMESERQHLRVVPGGWRNEVAIFLQRQVCAGSMVEDFKDYLEIQHVLNTADMDEAEATRVYADRARAGQQAYEKYAELVKATWKEGMRLEPKTDVSVSQYAIRLAKTACPDKGEAIEQIYYLYEAIKAN